MDIDVIESITNRIDKVTEIPKEYLGTILPAPPSVKIELTGRCNMSCGFCAHRLKQKDQRDMDRDFFNRIVPEMVSSGVKELGLFYIGESLLCTWLPEAIRYAKESGIEYTFLTTNGTLLTEDRLIRIMDSGLDSLKFSFNNADSFQFRAVTGLPLRHYNMIKLNIIKAWEVRQRYGFKTKLYASSIKYDGDQQMRMESAVEDIVPFIDQHYWLPLFSFGGQVVDRETELNMLPTAGNPGRLDMMRPPLPCWAVFKEGHITWDGKLSACCFDSADKWEMADLNKVSFMDGWNSQVFQELRKAHISKDIRNTACMDCIAKGTL